MPDKRCYRCSREDHDHCDGWWVNDPSQDCGCRNPKHTKESSMDFKNAIYEIDRLSHKTNSATMAGSLRRMVADLKDMETEERNRKEIGAKAMAVAPLFAEVVKTLATSKIEAIKLVRERTGLGVVEAKSIIDLIDTAY